MQKIVKFIWTAAIALSMFLMGLVVSDKIYLRNQVIRLRVVAASDSTADQTVKLHVKDAINAYLQKNLVGLENAAQVKAYIQNNMSELKEVVNDALVAVGDSYSANVYLTRESTEKRDYDTFSLPSGVYETLRVDIGPAGGQNWWCVVFPSLCKPESVETFAGTATDAGMRPGLTRTLIGGRTFKVRFFLLDLMGKAEKFLNGS